MADEPLDFVLLLDAVSSVLAEITAIKVVHGVAGGGEDSTKVKPATMQLVDWPAIVLDDGSGDITAGSWERQELTISGAIWRNYDAVTFDEQYRESARDYDRLLDTIPRFGKAKSISPALQSLLLTHVDKTTSLEWPRDSNVWFLVRPFDLEVIVNRAAAYMAA